MLNIIFAGTPEFSVPCLDALVQAHYSIASVYTQPDRPAGRGRQVAASPVKQYALEHDIPVCQPISLSNAEAQTQLAALKPDVMIVVAYGLILPKAVLDIPRYGCVNVHASLLPRWRGAAPIQRAIQAGDDETGITIMQMDAGLDTGPMLHHVTCPIHPTDNAARLHDRLAKLGAQALLTVLQDLPSALQYARPQNDDNACYAKKLDKAQAKLNWQQPATQLALQVRAFNPWPMAYAFIADTRFRILQAEVRPHVEKAPGTIIQANEEGIDVATGNDVLRLQMIQLAGGKALPVNEILKSKQALFTPGVVLQ